MSASLSLWSVARSEFSQLHSIDPERSTFEPTPTLLFSCFLTDCVRLTWPYLAGALDFNLTIDIRGHLNATKCDVYFLLFNCDYFATSISSGYLTLDASSLAANYFRALLSSDSYFNHAATCHDCYFPLGVRYLGSRAAHLRASNAPLSTASLVARSLNARVQCG